MQEQKEHIKRAIVLAGHKLYSDYCRARYNHGVVVEPEHFHDIWMRKNIARVSHDFRLEVWRYFLNKLNAARRVA